MHFYHNRSFTQDQEKKLRNAAAESFTVENFLNDKEFDLLKKIFQKGINWNEIGEISKYHGFTWENEYGPILKWLKTKIDTILPNWDLDFLAFQEAIVPWKIHADIRWYETKLPYKTLLLPIDVIAKDVTTNQDQWLDTYTITFKQRSFLSNRKENDLDGDYGNKIQYQDNWLKPIEDPSIENLSVGYSVTPEQWQKYFTHIPYKYFEGLEIEKILHWKPKSLLVWDSTILHSSDNFLYHNIQTKKCLLISTILKN